MLQHTDLFTKPNTLESEPFPCNQIISFLFTTTLPWISTLITSEVIISGVLILILLFCSALISGSEVAYFNLDHADIDALKKEENDKPSERVTQLLERPAYLLATILVANNFINIGIIVLSIIALKPLDWFTEGMTNETLKTVLDYTINTVLVTFLLVLFGEVSPKIYAKLNSLGLAKTMSPVLLTLRKVLYPFNYLLVNSTSFLEQKLQAKVNTEFSADDLDQAIELTVSQEIGSEKEVDILKSIIQFNHIAVKQIMRSRVDVKALDFSADFKEVINAIKRWAYSRVPVFDGDFDNIIGVLHIKDLLKHLDESEEFEWQSLIRTNVMYAPESKKINDLLQEFQERRTHIAIVIDEFGGTSGIVTLEDVMEEVIGDIKDESDIWKEIEFEKINDYTYIFEGKTLLNDISKLLNIDMDLFEEIRGEADSLGGMMVEHYGFIPTKGKSLSHEQYSFQVETAGQKRVKRVKLTLPH